MPFMLPLALVAQSTVGAPPPLPSATFCAAVIGLAYDRMKTRGGDPEMTKGFGDDATALRQIVIAEQGSDAKADAAIMVERARLEGEAANRSADDPIDLKPCYRVKALGRGGE